MPLLTQRVSIVTLFLLSFGIGKVHAQSNSCITPSDFRQASYLENQAGLVWTAAGTSTSWEVAWGPQGTPIHNLSNRLIVSQTWCVLPGITASSSNVAYVRTVCGSAHSNWVGPISIGGLPTCNRGVRFPSEYQVICGNQSALLTTPNGDQAMWWCAGVPLHYGSDYQTDTLFNDRTYWLTPAMQNGASQNIGPSLQSQTGGFANFNSGLVIEVQDTLVLDSVTLMADGAVNFSVQVWNYQGAQLISETDELSFDQAGEERFHLNLPMLPGLYTLKLDIQPGGGRLFRSVSNQSFPYVLPGLISIDSTTNGLNNRYYYLYDLSVSYICQSRPSSYHIAVGNQGMAGYDSSDTLCARDTVYSLSDILLSARVSQNGYWKNLSNGDSIQTIDAQLYQPGDRLELQYIAPGSHGCSDTSYHHILFKDCKIDMNEDFAEAWTLYPNPAKSTIRINTDNADLQKVTVITSEGREVAHFDNQESEYSIEHLPPGIYFVHVSCVTFSHVFKLEKL